jgi:hypothetical protein
MLVEESWIDNAFYLVGTDQPAEVVWTMWADGVYVAGGGSSPWTELRMYLEGSGWIEEEATPPGTKLWELDEIFGPPVGPDIPHGVSVPRRQVRFTVQPGVYYALRQQNLSRLNYFDLGYCQGTVTSTVELVPEPGSIALLATGLAGLLWPLRRRARA